MIFPDGTIFPSKSDITIPSNGATTDILKGGLPSAIIFKLHVGEYLEAQASLEILHIFLSIISTDKSSHSSTFADIIWRESRHNSVENILSLRETKVISSMK